MKKTNIVFIVVIMIVILTACGKSQAVQDVETAISNIGEVSLDSEQIITDAEKQYNALSEKDAEKVENYSQLIAAREKYNSLIYDAAIGSIENYDFEKAVSLLESIPSYKDAQNKLSEAKDGVFQSKCATYVFNFVKDGGFYNPSAVRVLDASYGGEKDSYAKALYADGLLYLKIQGTNRLGGTLNQEFVIIIGGSHDSEVYSNEDSGKDYKQSDKVIDVPTINKMLQKYWNDYGIN